MVCELEGSIPLDKRIINGAFAFRDLIGNDMRPDVACRVVVCIVLLATSRAWADPTEELRARLDSVGGSLQGAAAAAQSQLCQAAATAAEVKYGLPAGLLQAISNVESGRLIPGAGRIGPWPWSVNANGEGHYFTSRAEAIAWVRDAQAKGIASIDIGCLQVNLMFHPHAFATLETALDPVENADYAARFLRRLRSIAGDWQTATGFYHSQTVSLAIPYRERVALALRQPWPQERHDDVLGKLRRAWLDTIQERAAGAGGELDKVFRLGHRDDEHWRSRVTIMSGGRLQGDDS